MDLPVMPPLTVSRHCQDGLHNWCAARETCQCSSCHKGPCDICKATNLQNVFKHPADVEAGEDNPREVCAPCYRKIRSRMPVPETMCDDCGKPGAFRNPKTRATVFRCAHCHLASGEVVQLHGGTNKLIAPCTGLDINDDRHTWVHIRGSRFRCLCGTDKYSAEMRAALRDEYLRDN